jgi:hypothetical protein
MRWVVTDEHYAASLRLLTQSAKSVCALADTIQAGFTAMLALFAGIVGVLCSLVAAAFYRGDLTVDLATAYVSLGSSCLAIVAVIAGVAVISRAVKWTQQLAKIALALSCGSLGALISLAFSEAFL